MLTATQVCERLGISRDTLRKLINDGQFPGAMKATPGPLGHWRIPDESLAAYLERNAVTPRQEAVAP